MESHSFTSDDAAQNTDKVLQYIAESFDPKYDKDYRENPRSSEKQVNKDINRGVFYLETQDGELVNLLAKCKLGKDQDYKVTYQDMHDMLTNDYHLSKTQTEYILAANHQSSIVSAMAGFNQLKMKAFIGGQKFMFDCSMDAFLPHSDLRKMMGTKFNSQDYMAVNITASLGKAGDPEPKTQVAIDVAGTGKIADQSKQIVSKKNLKQLLIVIRLYRKNY